MELKNEASPQQDCGVSPAGLQIRGKPRGIEPSHDNKILRDYFNYLTVIKARSPHTISGLRVDLCMLFLFIYRQRNPSGVDPPNYYFADIDFIKCITLNDIHAFIAYCQVKRKSSIATCGRKIISIRQFWKYLKSTAHLIDNNITEELETPRLPKRIPKYLSLDDSIRLLMNTEDSPRTYCIITLFLNCAMRLSELVNLNIEHIKPESLTVIGKGNKERQIFLTPAAKGAIYAWLAERESYYPKDDALFVNSGGTRISARSVQRILENAVKASGLPEYITPHKLRHTAATILYKHGRVDIRALQEILGHASISTTEIYTHIDDQQLQTAINANLLSTVTNKRR